jgi:Ser-tRNA(Ala) deacylase AlaX
LTKLLFRDNPYLAACEARVTARIPGVDLPACGGTHVRNTAEIGAVAVARIRSEGKRNKRLTLVLT